VALSGGSHQVESERNLTTAKQDQRARPGRPGRADGAGLRQRLPRARRGAVQRSVVRDRSGRDRQTSCAPCWRRCPQRPSLGERVGCLAWVDRRGAGPVN